MTIATFKISARCHENWQRVAEFRAVLSCKIASIKTARSESSAAKIVEIIFCYDPAYIPVSEPT